MPFALLLLLQVGTFEAVRAPVIVGLPSLRLQVQAGNPRLKISRRPASFTCRYTSDTTRPWRGVGPLQIVLHSRGVYPPKSVWLWRTNSVGHAASSYRFPTWGGKTNCISASLKADHPGPSGSSGICRKSVRFVWLWADKTTPAPVGTRSDWGRRFQILRSRLPRACLWGSTRSLSACPWHFSTVVKEQQNGKHTDKALHCCRLLHLGENRVCRVGARSWKPVSDSIGPSLRAGDISGRARAFQSLVGDPVWTVGKAAGLWPG